MRRCTTSCARGRRRDGRRSRKQRRPENVISRARCARRLHRPRNRRSGNASTSAVPPRAAGPHERFTRASHRDLPKQRERMRLYAVLTAALLVAGLGMDPVLAERPIVDLHRLDANFQLFAADSSVPWKPATVRLDTYSSAPVSFSVYQVDPAEVLTAGSNFNPRAIATSRLRSVVSFTFTPPGGYQFQSNVVNVPLGARGILRRGSAPRQRRRAGLGQSVASRYRFEGNAGWIADLRSRSGNRHAARANARAVRRQSKLRHRGDRWRRHRALESLAPSRLRPRAVGKQLRVLEPAAAAAGSVDDRRRANRLRGGARR